MFVDIYQVDGEKQPFRIVLPDRELSPFWEEVRAAGRLVVYGQVTGWCRNGLEYLTGNRGCRCDGCAQDECGRELAVSPVTGSVYVTCSFCPFRGGEQREFIHFPAGTRIECVPEGSDPAAGSQQVSAG